MTLGPLLYNTHMFIKPARLTPYQRILRRSLMAQLSIHSQVRKRGSKAYRTSKALLKKQIWRHDPAAIPPIGAAVLLRINVNYSTPITDRLADVDFSVPFEVVRYTDKYIVMRYPDPNVGEVRVPKGPNKPSAALHIAD